MKYSCLKCGYSVLLAGCRRVICEKCKNRLVFEEYNEPNEYDFYAGVPDTMEGACVFFYRFQT